MKVINEKADPSGDRAKPLHKDKQTATSKIGGLLIFLGTAALLFFLGTIILFYLQGFPGETQDGIPGAVMACIAGGLTVFFGVALWLDK